MGLGLSEGTRRAERSARIQVAVWELARAQHRSSKVQTGVS